jgi:hypothetical protein
MQEEGRRTAVVRSREPIVKPAAGSLEDVHAGFAA